MSTSGADGRVGSTDDVQGGNPLQEARPEGSGLPRRIRGTRVIGMMLGALCVGAAMLQHAPPAWSWLAMAVQVIVWPHVAYLLSCRSTTPREAEHRNLIADCALSALWIPEIGFNVLPSAVCLTMVTMDTVAVGGVRLMIKGTIAGVAGIGVGCLAFGIHWQPVATLTTIIACLPVMIAYPLTVGVVMHRLSSRLADKRRSLERSERLVRHTLDAMEAAIVLYDAQDQLLLCNEAFVQQHRSIAPMLQPGQARSSILRSSVEHGLIPEARMSSTWVSDHLRARPSRAVHTRESADGRWNRILEQCLPDGGLLSFSTDITDIVQRERELERLNEERDQYAVQLREVNARLELLTQTDALTGVANRRLFDQRLHEEWKRSQRHGFWLALVMIDVDYFKKFNDLHGHVAGDACLRRVAQALQACARRTSDVVARYGGEEFVLLLPHTGLTEATLVAGRCLAAIDEQAIVHGTSTIGSCVTISLGVVALCPQFGRDEDATGLVRRADSALYAAKAAGRHRVEQAAADEIQ